MDIDTVKFRRAAEEASAPKKTKPRPGISIDTNINKPSLFTREFRSSSPYGILLDYTDATRAFVEMEITTLKITYADGKVEPGVAKLGLPLTWRFHPYEAVNSTSSGVVRKKLRVLSADVENVITRDEDFRVELSGRFRKEGDALVPFELDQRFEKVRDKRTVTRAELFKDV